MRNLDNLLFKNVKVHENTILYIDKNSMWQKKNIAKERKEGRKEKWKLKQSSFCGWKEERVKNVSIARIISVYFQPDTLNRRIVVMNRQTNKLKSFIFKENKTCAYLFILQLKLKWSFDELSLHIVRKALSIAWMMSKREKK